MGLDMYLSAEMYIGSRDYNRNAINKNADNANPQHKAILKLLKAEKYASTEEGISVHLPIGYWRKANAIHAWFVRELAKGVDECQNINVSRDDLKSLRDLCKKILKDKSKASLLPPQGGFFFGSTEIDDSYFSDLTDTIAICNRALTSPHDCFIYRASW